MMQLLQLHFLVPLLLVLTINVTASPHTKKTTNIQASPLALVIPRHAQQRHRNRVPRPTTSPMPSSPLHTNTRQRHAIITKIPTRGSSSVGIISLPAVANEEEEEQQPEKSTDPIKSYGFDNPKTGATPTENMSEDNRVSDERLRASLDYSAKFKVKNDARFAWSTTFLVCCVYAYGCLGGEDGAEILAVAGIPNGELLGGVGGIVGALGSALLFFLPELLGNKRRNR